MSTAVERKELLNLRPIQLDELDSDDDDFKRHPKGRHRFPCCCLGWKADTWRGLGAIFSGMMIQAAIGIASIWGNIVIYVTSKLRGEDPNLSL